MRRLRAKSSSRSGSTESNNLALKGVVRTYESRGRHIVTAATEHKCVLNACKALREDGYEVTILPVADDGSLAVAAVEGALRPDTVLVSLMHANNEIGVIHDIAAIGALCRARGGAAAHRCHAVVRQGARGRAGHARWTCWSMSGHKMYGPKGVGALYVRTPCKLAPQLDGGGHEFGLRSGTLNVPGIVGLADSVVLACADLETDRHAQRAMRDWLWLALQDAYPSVLLNGPDPIASPDLRLPEQPST